MRQPDNIHRLKGNYRPCRHGKVEEKPKIDSNIPDPPIFLDEFAKEEFTRIGKILGAVDVLSDLDLVILTQYAVLYSELRRDPEKFGAAKHSQLRMVIQELGLSPTSRTKLRTNEALSKKVNENPFSAL